MTVSSLQRATRPAAVSRSPFPCSCPSSSRSSSPSSSPSPIRGATAPRRPSAARPGPWLVCLLAAGGLAAPAAADLVIDSGDPSDPGDDLVLDVRDVVGEGPFRSYLVVDFGATGGDSYAYEWRWDPGADARGATMLLAILQGTDLMAELGGEDGQGFGIFVENFTLPGEDEAGDPSAFWSYWLAEEQDIDPGVPWTAATEGASFRQLADGSVDGWYNGFDGTEPAVPTVVVPAPGVLSVLAMAGLGRGSRRRRA